MGGWVVGPADKGPVAILKAKARAKPILAFVFSGGENTRNRAIGVRLKEGRGGGVQGIGRERERGRGEKHKRHSQD